MKRKVILLLVVIVWSSVLFFFSGQSAVNSGELSLGLADRLLILFPGIDMDALELEHIVRKLAHFAIFAVEGLLLYLALNAIWPEKLRNSGIAAGICAAVGVLNELHQLLAEERSCQFSDMLLDAAGGIVGVGSGIILVWALSKLDRRHSV